MATTTILPWNMASSPIPYPGDDIATPTTPTRKPKSEAIKNTIQGQGGEQKPGPSKPFFSRI
jgi:hypothetical protein